ncbi:hybrid sensor histidine kinase/response regulator [Anaeromyxobacter diazotrophicus]|uniref:histidine kinase n=1 Tax=Anaeromyxobacter diazotrophicus TaxID=2590199 RepID=A0A7I9VGG4_9BACT|nr:ATP-binding protein [Anaeromyxobacter diazotrophicus]GEJ55486.1 hypothetical protein AMYX_02270 [Anaeromyxobacter diazotrophicus]
MRETGMAGQDDGAPLRRRAEERLERQKPARTPPPRAAARRLVHELEVHQVELELQNEELRATRLEAEAAAKRYAELYEFAPLGYATLSGDGRLRALNLAGARLLGAERSRLVGKPLEWFVAPADQAALRELLAEALQGGEDGRSCRELALVQGGVRRARLTTSLLWHGDPEILLTIEDVTERWRLLQERTELLQVAQDARARAEEASRAKDAFLATLSHELRNPLAPISNSLSVLEQAEAGSDQARRAGEVMHRQIGHLVHLVDDLLDVTRITQGKIHLRRQRLDLYELAGCMVEDHRSLFERSGVRLELAPPPAPVVVEGDWDRLAQVIGNLLQNAAKFCRRGGKTRVTVAASRRERCAVVRVSDDGVGMAPEMLARLFQPFMQADTTLDRSKGGLGLGMALSKGLVELHGGRIAARSEGLGAGSEFEVRLPLAGPPAEPAHPAPPDRARAHRRVLIIEDNVDAAEALRELLELHRHQVGVAFSGPEGLAKAHELRPEIVICDIGLPGMDGCEVARAIRADEDEALRGAYLIALSGYAQPDDLRRARESGFQRHLVKPADPEQLERLFTEAPPAEAPQA